MAASSVLPSQSTEHMTFLSTTTPGLSPSLLAMAPNPPTTTEVPVAVSTSTEATTVVPPMEPLDTTDLPNTNVSMAQLPTDAQPELPITSAQTTTRQAPLSKSTSVDIPPSSARSNPPEEYETKPSIQGVTTSYKDKVSPVGKKIISWPLNTP